MPPEFDPDAVDGIQEVPRATPDLRTELARQLQDLAPEVIADGKVDVEKLRELLGDDAGPEGERFGLFWPGKKRALRAAQEPTTATLRPDKANSKDWDTTKNVFIEGDNLEVLKILQKHYHGKIKMIYIDPPYNTGKDFVYPDNYREGLATYLEWTKQVTEEGKKVSTNTESEGRYHSNWLNMMYPRLKLARNLLTDDGVIFLAIDDHELDNLLRLGKEVFGENAYLGTISWLKKRKGSFLSKGIVSIHEYILVFGRNPGVELFGGKADATESQPLVKRTNPRALLTFPPSTVATKLSDGEYRPGVYGTGSSAVELLQLITVSEGIVQERFELIGPFIWSQAYLDDQLGRGGRIVMNTMNFQPRAFKASSDKDFKGLSSVFNGVANSATNEDAYEYSIEIFGREGVFDYPKPVNYIKAIVQAATEFDKHSIILDFFAGSGTTADAVMRLNAEDGGRRRHIQVQLPEPTPDGSPARTAGFTSLAEIARFRISKAGDRIVGELDAERNDGARNLDIGYRTYTLADTSFKKWRVDSAIESDELANSLFELRDSTQGSASPNSAAVLSELLLKQGYSLTETVAEVKVGSLQLASVGRGLLLALLDSHTKPTLDQLREIVDSEPTRFVILEDAFHGDDELKTNLAQLCKSKGVELWTA